MDEIMSTERRQILRRGLQVWMKSLQLDDVLVYLQQADIIDDSVADYVKSQSNIHQGRYELIRQLERRGNKAFVEFYHALNFSGQRSLALSLADTLSDEEKRESNSVVPTFCEALREVNGNAVGEASRSKFVNDPEDMVRYMKQGFNCSTSNMNLASTSKHFLNEEPRGVLHDLLVECIDNKNGKNSALTEFDEKEVYRNFSTPRGLALIINNRNFKQMTERVGTDIDEHNLENLFSQLGYRISVVKDLTAKASILITACKNVVAKFKGMLQTIQMFSKRSEHKMVDSCIVSVLTHGEHNELFGIDDVPVSVHEFMSSLNALNCPALAHKPKIFILQACRGQRYDPGIYVNRDETDTFVGACFGFRPKQSSCTADISQKLPSEADFLIAYATVPGYVSWRNSSRGSWFIQSLCEVFAKFSKQSDILEMMTLVNKRVAEVYESSRDAYKQVPECATRLRKKFFFFPGLSIPPVANSSI